ncbi:MAG: hypothetical protein A3F11_11565 [Gammaproteobacteria bacterium RIFCSPHIGHO2_12_FULL_37_14]|nr:MAG: hypothetical protein A3F11_11565 [Gammaproteobacteria bacterium RIFCSPHIGHO2_12_FULL_37_14]
MTLKVVTILFLFFGEAFSVYSEMVAAKSHQIALESSSSIYIKACLLIAMAGCLLIAGYMIGYKSYRNIWIVSAMSITSILIMEPLIGYIVFQQLPTRGALIGLIFGAIGFVATFT